MIKGGYYIKARCIQESDVAHCSPAVREIWDWLLMKARFKDEKYGSFIIKRGQFFCSYKDIREGLSWHIGYRKETYSESVTKHAMSTLRKLTMISTTKEPRGVVVTICNYELYQNPANYERTTNEPANEPTNEPLTNHPRPSINKEPKKVRTKESNNTAFDTFYSAYPKKKNKGTAEKAWLKIKPSDYENINIALANACKSDDWTKDNGKFIPYPSTWLNAKGWEDVIYQGSNKAEANKRLVEKLTGNHLQNYEQGALSHGKSR